MASSATLQTPYAPQILQLPACLLACFYSAPLVEFYSALDNTGGGTLTGAATVPAPFSIASGGTYSLAAGASQTVTVKFTPAAALSYSQNVTFTGGAGATRAVSGTGTSIAVNLIATPTCANSSPVINLSWTLSGGTASTYDVYRNGASFYPGDAGTTFSNTSVTAGQSYSYYVLAHLSSGGTTTSNTVTATAAATCMAPAPAITVTPSSVAFGSVPVGASATQTFTVQNSGSGTLTGSAGAPAPFNVTSGGTYNLAAGATQTVTVSFSPTAATSYSQNVTFTGGAGVTRAVTGTGVSVGVNLSATTKCNVSSPEIDLSFTLSGATESTFDLYRNGSLHSPSNIGTTFGNYGSSVVAGQSYSYYVVVHLTSGSTVTSNTVSATAPPNCGTPAITVTPSSVAFGSVPVGSSATQNFTVQNSGTGTLTGTTTVSAPFNVTSGGSYSLAAGASQTVTVSFSPTAATSYSQNVTFTGGTGATRSVTGTGTQATVSLSASTACYQSGPEINLSFTLSGATESSFDLYRNSALYSAGVSGTTFANVGSNVVAGQSYSYYVVVHLTSGSTTTSNTVSATAPSTCGTPTITVTPSSVAFGSVPVGSSATQNFTVQNSGTGTLTGSAGVPAPFNVTSGGTYNLSAGASQTVTVRFSPTAATSYFQNVTFTGGAGATRTVTGTGTQATVSLSASTTCYQSGPEINLSFTLSGATESTFDLYRNSALYSAGVSGTTFANVGSNVVAGQNYSYYVVVHLSSGSTATSNTVSATAPSTCGTPAITVTPSSLAFGSVPVGSSATQNFTVQNSGNGTLTGSATVPAPFTIYSGSVYSLAAGATQTVTVRFSPTAATSYSQNISFTGGAGATRSVTGTGTQATVSLSASTTCYQSGPEINLSFTLSGGTESTFDLYRNSALYSAGVSGTTFANVGSNVTKGQTYSYYVVVHLSSGSTATSNTVSATAPSTCK